MEGLIRAFARLPDGSDTATSWCWCAGSSPWSVTTTRCWQGPRTWPTGQLLLTGLVSDDRPSSTSTAAPGWWRTPPSTRGTGCRWSRPWPAGPRWWPPTPPRSGSWWRPRPPSTRPTPTPWPGPSSGPWSRRPSAASAPLVGPPPANLVRRGRARRRRLPELSNRAGRGPPASAGGLAPASAGGPGHARGRRPPPAWPRTPVAWPGPWPHSVEVELFIDGDTADEHAGRPRVHLLPGPGPAPGGPGPGGYDAVIACVGNSEHHAGALALLRRDRVHAAVLAHDVRLNGLYRHGAARGAVPEGIAAVLAGLYEGATEEWLTDGWLQPAEAEPTACTWPGSSSAWPDPFIVTSEFAAELARRRRPAGGPGPGGASPPSPTRRRWRRPAGRGATRAGRPPSVWSTGSSSPSWSAGGVRPRPPPADPATRLAFVGPIDPALLERYHALAVRLGVAGAVTFTGPWTTTSTSRGWPGHRWRSSFGPAPTGRPRRRWPTASPTESRPWSPTPARPSASRLRGQGPGGRHPAELAETLGRAPSTTTGAGPAGGAGLAYVAARGFDRGARQLLEGVGLAPSRAAGRTRVSRSVVVVSMRSGDWLDPCLGLGAGPGRPVGGGGQRLGPGPRCPHWPAVRRHGGQEPREPGIRRWGQPGYRGRPPGTSWPCSTTTPSPIRRGWTMPRTPCRTPRWGR